jgi:hypothetical protein
MTPIVNQKALDDFLEHADSNQARRAAVALEAMAAAARLAVVELEDLDPDDLTSPLVPAGGR